MGANQLKADACPLQPERRVLSWQMHHLLSASIVGVPRLQCFQLLYQVDVVCGLRLQYELLGGDASVDNRQAPSSFAQPLRPLFLATRHLTHAHEQPVREASAVTLQTLSIVSTSPSPKSRLSVGVANKEYSLAAIAEGATAERVLTASFHSYFATCVLHYRAFPC